MGARTCSTNATSCRGNHTAVRAHLWGETDSMDIIMSKLQDVGECDS